MNEILDAHVSEPGSSSRSSTASYPPKENNNCRAPSTNEPSNNTNKNNIFSSSSCSKLSSVSKQTVVPIIKRDSHASTVFGSLNNLNANNFKEFDFEEDDEEMDDDDVFLNEVIRTLSSRLGYDLRLVLVKVFWKSRLV